MSGRNANTQLNQSSQRKRPVKPTEPVVEKPLVDKLVVAKVKNVKGGKASTAARNTTEKSASKSSKTSTEMSSDVDFEFNVYYGIFYPADLADIVLDILKTEKKYAGLAGDKKQIKVGKFSVFASTNSDFEPTLGFIAIDDMTFGSDPEDDPEHLTLNFDPVKMENSVVQYKVAVGALEDIYNVIVTKFKAKKLSVGDLYLGWKGTVCTWELGSDDEDDS